MASTPKNTVSRFAFIDWSRGLAAVIMLQGHVFHSLTSKDLRDGGPYVLSQFVGGMPPAIFLFLTGVTLAFLMDSRERQGFAASERVWAAVRRAGYLLSLAFLFRLQLWVFGLPNSRWTDLWKVDILNCMALAVVAMAPMAVFTTAERVRQCAVVGFFIAAASPLVSALDWSATPALLRHYLAPDYNYFSFFPWAAFLAFGVSGGSILRLCGADQMNRLMQWACLGGIGLVMAGQYFSNLPYSVYSKADFWLDSPALIFIKLGVMLLILSFAFLWNQHGVGQRWSWVRQLGMNSLLVYWVHVELVYGRWLWTWRERLSVAQTVFASVAVILLMLGLTIVWNRRDGWRGIVVPLQYRLSPARRVSGD